MWSRHVTTRTKSEDIIGIPVKVNEVWYWDDGAIYKVDPGKITMRQDISLNIGYGYVKIYRTL